MEAKVTFLEGMHFEAKLGSGYRLEMDASPQDGGKGEGGRPMEMLLAGLGGCTGMDVVDILRKGRHQVTGLEVNVTGERRQEYPMVFTKIHIEYVVRGRNLPDEAVTRAIQLSEDKYCSAAAMLRSVAKIDWSYRIEEAS